MRIHILMHESFEGAAAIEKWIQSKGHQVSYSRVYAGEKLPANPDKFDFLLVMGGPQSPDTTKAECAHFDAEAEQKFIKQAIDADKFVLGICLGAQLIGESLGAKFEHSPNKEIGIFNITLTEAAKADPLFSQLPHTFPVAHWHGGMPGLTLDAQLLAYSEGCPRQIIRYTPKVHGFQCHFEITREAIAGLIENGEHEIKAGGKYIQDVDTLKRYNYTEMNEKLFFFLDHIEKEFASSCCPSKCEA